MMYEQYRSLHSDLFGCQQTPYRLTDWIYPEMFTRMQILSNQFHYNPDADDASDEDDVDERMTSRLREPELAPYMWTPLHVAAQRGNDEFVNLLLNNGSEIDSQLHAVPASASLPFHPRSKWPDWSCETPLHLAILAGHNSTVRLLLARGASTVVSSFGVTVLHLVAGQGDLELCRSLVDQDPQQVDSRTNAQLTPFHYAVAGGQLQTADRFLLERGADIQALFDGEQVQRYGFHYFVPQVNNAFTCALWALQHADASTLLDMDPNFAVISEGGGWFDAVVSCLVSLDVDQPDDGQLVSVLRYLLLRSKHNIETTCESFSEYWLIASARHLPHVTKALLEVAQTRALPLPDIGSWLKRAIQYAWSIAAVDGIMALIEYGVTTQGMPIPSIACVVEPTPNLFDRCGGTPTTQFEARLEIAKLVYQRLLASPEGVDDSDLRAALLAACRPGGLKMCEWLASIGALRAMDKADLVIMLDRVARLKDQILTEWVLTQAGHAGEKDWVMNRVSLSDIILDSSDTQTALVLARHGVDLNVAVDSWEPTRDGSTRFHGLFSCRTRQQMPTQPYHSVHYGSNLFFLVCGNPGMAGASELLRLAIHVARESAKELVNCHILMFEVFTGPRAISPVSLLCCANIPTKSPPAHSPSFRSRRPEIIRAISEPTRLTMLQMILDVEVDEVHTLAEIHHGGDVEDYGGPSESLWSALTSEGKLEILDLQGVAPDLYLPRDQMAGWVVHYWQYNPIECAIKGGFPTLVQAILEARPLPTRNHPAALRYLGAACGVYHLGDLSDRLSPRVLEILLAMASLDHADLPISWGGDTALLTLLKFYGTHGICHAPTIHRCRCEPEFLGPDKNDLSNMVRPLLLHGAKWKTRYPDARKSAIEELRDLMSKLTGGIRVSVYKQHNLAQLRKHIVLDLDSAAACSPDSFLDFNPFEMGDIKATEGSG
jgi:hypothetical protein